MGHACKLCTLSWVVSSRRLAFVVLLGVVARKSLRNRMQPRVASGSVGLRLRHTAYEQPAVCRQTKHATSGGVTRTTLTRLMLTDYCGRNDMVSSGTGRKTLNALARNKQKQPGVHVANSGAKGNEPALTNAR